MTRLSVSVACVVQREVVIVCLCSRHWSPSVAGFAGFADDMTGQGLAKMPYSAFLWHEAPSICRQVGWRRVGLRGMSEMTSFQWLSIPQKITLAFHEVSPPQLAPSRGRKAAIDIFGVMTLGRQALD